MTLATLLIIIIPSIGINFISLFFLIKVLHAAEKQLDITADYLKQVTFTSIDIIKKMQEPRQ